MQGRGEWERGVTVLHKGPFPPRSANTQAQAGSDGAVGACPQKQKTRLGRQVQVDSGGLDCGAKCQGLPPHSSKALWGFASQLCFRKTRLAVVCSIGCLNGRNTCLFMWLDALLPSSRNPQTKTPPPTSGTLPWKTRSATWVSCCEISTRWCCSQGYRLPGNVLLPLGKQDPWLAGGASFQKVLAAESPAQPCHY